MKDKLRQFVGAKRGVSPVIGVVLMVAVVVILAAVIGAFVLGLGGDQQTTPQASFSLDGTTLTMSGGDTLQGDNIQVKANSNDVQTAGGKITAGTVISTAIPENPDSVQVVYTGNGESAIIWQTGGGGGGNNGGNQTG